MKFLFKKYLSFGLVFIITMSNLGCSSSRDVKGRDFEVTSVVKNDIDLVSETHQSFVFSALNDLATKLYKRNPNEWKKEGHESLEMAVNSLVADPFPAIIGMTNIECIRLTFDENYKGDRVKTFIVGLEAMVLASYNDNRSFYLYSMLDAQKLYDSARNFELASWLIRTKRKNNGELFLLNSESAEQYNVSFERLFGKMINAQDLMAQIMADRNHRQIKNVIQAVATAFIPI